ncbi:MAG TPA: 4-(cytidine 5'-diphospho)-2-C-methyl-D-erythritol kinase [Ornithinimicrobium sp.]|uniref:4-(cytidine 5'-diphospho)-2-C-methyl-D-erythritol kinase n=1 Tax=Ornithinimicrobium sp. TaxID=1977084 RepID=UPI002B45B8C3|nr:4-(cytidine 5'-diphospho)-2-C-methyl-D-erythritol kinase [Ornithinimicrobium sp.]HKJ12879.1 4-(cytidine 5'-diphospho)-2-C-methyl-D-erythritol kinase [Ornithinimicrobium sp.]
MIHAADRQQVTVRVPGKVNLELVVGPLRPDGYHELVTVFQAVGVHDRVRVEPASTWSVRAGGPYGGQVPADRSNLAAKAAHLLAQYAPDFLDQGAAVEVGPVAISIDKHIPVAAGMAGGSADAAAALVGCAELWKLTMQREDLESVGARIGADVPFMLHGGTAVGSGRGDDISPVLARGEAHWVLWVSRGEGLSAAEVYAEFDRLHESAAPAAPELSTGLAAALRTMDTAAMGRLLRNDLAPAALSLQPHLQEVIDTGLDLGAQGATISGSGPTVAFLVGSQADALDLSMGLAARGPEGEIVRVTGPVPGAHVIDASGPGVGPRRGGLS